MDLVSLVWNFNTGNITMNGMDSVTPVVSVDLLESFKRYSETHTSPHWPKIRMWNEFSITGIKFYRKTV